MHFEWHYKYDVVCRLSISVAANNGNAGGGAPQTGCAQKIQGRFNAQFGNPPAAAISDIGARGWTLFGAPSVTDNILVGFNLGTLAAGQVYPGRFGGGTFGFGSTLHVVSFSVGTMPGDTTGTLFDIAQAHLDQGNPFTLPFGWISHLAYVLTHGAGACP
jgi:hypothetical protein